MPPIIRAVILARGLGTRMRARASASSLTEAQAEVAATGVKAMIPLAGGRPFLDYLLSALADAGIKYVCLVVGPEHHDIRTFYRDNSTHPRRLNIDFAIQQVAIGTADAVLSAEWFTRGEPFLVMNADNYYPPDVLATLCRTTPSALPAFSRSGLLREEQIPIERIARYALLDIDENGILRRIVEKPDPETAASLGDARVSMNLWSFTPLIFDACRAIPMSPRGELELPLAVQFAIEALHMRFTTIPVDAAVLDLSHQADIPAVAKALEHVDVRL